MTIWSTGYGRGFGGTEQMVNALARRLPAEGARIQIVTNGDPRQPRANVYFTALPDEVAVHVDTFPNPLLGRRPALFLGSLFQYCKGAARLSALFRRCPPNVVHMQFVSVDLFLLVLYKYLFGYRLVVTFCGGDLSVARRSAMARLKVRTAIRHADAVTAVSRELADCLRDRFQAREVVHISNGVDCPEIRAKAEGDASAVRPDHFVYVGRLHPDKRVPLLVQIFKESVDAGCDRDLYVVGDGEDRDAVERVIAQYGLGDRIIMLGAMTHRNTLSVLARSRCLLLCSSEEGCPNVILEAMALGVPAIAPRVGGVPELIADGDTGYLFPVNDPSTASAHIMRVARDGVGARAMGQRCADFAGRHLALTNTVQKYMSIYRALPDRVEPARSTPVPT